MGIVTIATRRATRGSSDQQHHFICEVCRFQSPWRDERAIAMLDGAQHGLTCEGKP